MALHWCYTKLDLLSEQRRLSHATFEPMNRLTNICPYYHKLLPRFAIH